MSPEEFLKKTKGKKITWSAWNNKNTWIVPENVDNEGYIKFNLKSDTIHTNWLVVNTGIYNKPQSFSCWLFVDAEKKSHLPEFL